MKFLLALFVAINLIMPVYGEESVECMQDECDLYEEGSSPQVQFNADPEEEEVYMCNGTEDPIVPSNTSSHKEGQHQDPYHEKLSNGLFTKEKSSEKLVFVKEFNAPEHNQSAVHPVVLMEGAPIIHHQPKKKESLLAVSDGKILQLLSDHLIVLKKKEDEKMIFLNQTVYFRR